MPWSPAGAIKGRHEYKVSSKSAAAALRCRPFAGSVTGRRSQSASQGLLVWTAVTVRLDRAASQGLLVWTVVTVRLDRAASQGLLVCVPGAASPHRPRVVRPRLGADSRPFYVTAGAAPVGNRP